MNRLFNIILTVVLLSSASFALGDVSPAAVHKIVLAEFAAMRLPTKSPFCLAILPARNTSETGADPSPQLLRFLIGKGMRPQKASTCYEPLPKGNVISIETVAASADGVSVKVAFTDVTITSDKDLGAVHRHGIYELRKSRKGGWMIQSYKAG
ncbi:MAG: hypothetical protein WBQ72_07025 [Terriglobales bacterium]|jgi:hypothetical protein